MLTDFPRSLPTACRCTFQTRWKNVERREHIRRWVSLRRSRDTIWKGRPARDSPLFIWFCLEDLFSHKSNWPSISIISEHSGNDSGTTSLLAELFESVVTIIDQHGDDLTSSFGGAAVQAVVQSLNKVCLLPQLRVSSTVCKKYLYLFLPARSNASINLSTKLTLVFLQECDVCGTQLLKRYIVRHPSNTSQTWDALSSECS